MKQLKDLKIGESVEICAMANLRPENTGLPMVVWVFPKTGKEKHGPRMKVQNRHGNKVNTEDWSSVTIEEIPRVIGKLNSQDFSLVKEFIKLNYKLLLKLWNDEIDSVEFIRRFKGII